MIPTHTTNGPRRAAPHLMRFLFWACILWCVFPSCKEDEAQHPVDTGPALPAATNLQPMSLSDTAITIRWDYPANLLAQVRFAVEQKTANTAFRLVGMTGYGVKRFTDRGSFSGDSVYIYRVTSQGESQAGTPSQNSPPMRLDLSSPYDLTAGFYNDGAVIIKWKFDGTTAIEFLIMQSGGDTSHFRLVKNIDGFSREVVISGVFSTDTLYYFRVQVRLMYNMGRPVTVPARLMFARPTNLIVSTLSLTEADLRWRYTSSFETGLQIEQGSDSVHFAPVRTVGIGVTTSVIVGSYDSATTYYFRVRAISRYNVSAYSAVASAAIARTMAFIEGGTFLMGSPEGSGYSDEHPRHYVTVHNFFIDKCEVTQARWSEIVLWKQTHGGTGLDPDPSFFKGGVLPVESVSWNDVREWIGCLNEKEGTTRYRLPTEAEWEFVARGGVFGTGTNYAGGNIIDSVAWYNFNSDDRTHAVGTKKPNELGIYDMSGNVWEWCSDWYGTYPAAPQIDPVGPSSGPGRVLRGGSWGYLGGYGCRVACREGNSPHDRKNFLGFRYVKD